MSFYFERQVKIDLIVSLVSFLSHFALKWVFILLLLNQDLSFFENTVDPDHLVSYETI